MHGTWAGPPLLARKTEVVPDEQEGHVHLEAFAAELPLQIHEGELTGCLMDRMNGPHRNTIEVDVTFGPQQ